MGWIGYFKNTVNQVLKKPENFQRGQWLFFKVYFFGYSDFHSLGSKQSSNIHLKINILWKVLDPFAAENLLPVYAFLMEYTPL